MLLRAKSAHKRFFDKDPWFRTQSLGIYGESAYVALASYVQGVNLESQSSIKIQI